METGKKRLQKRRQKRRKKKKKKKKEDEGKMLHGDIEDGSRLWERKLRQKKEMRSKKFYKMIGKRWIGGGGGGGERTNAI